jgi:hypothetical protein
MDYLPGKTIVNKQRQIRRKPMWVTPSKVIRGRVAQTTWHSKHIMYVPGVRHEEIGFMLTLLGFGFALF